MNKLKPATILKRLRSVNKKIQDKKGEIQDLRIELEQLKSRCEHEWRYAPDPSGGMDSSYVCDICDKWT